MELGPTLHQRIPTERLDQTAAAPPAPETHWNISAAPNSRRVSLILSASHRPKPCSGRSHVTNLSGTSGCAVGKTPKPSRAGQRKQNEEEICGSALASQHQSLQSDRMGSCWKMNRRGETVVLVFLQTLD